MSDPTLSPDGKFMWNGSEWIARPPNNQNLQMQDSVIAGDLVSNTIIQSSDASVVQAAMEGVVASIKELQPKAQPIQAPRQRKSRRKKRKHSLIKIIIGMLFMIIPAAFVVLWFDYYFIN